MFEPPSLPPAGWYPDPTDPYHNPRWWDGRAWAPSSWDRVSPGDFPGIGKLIADAFRSMWRRWRALATLFALTTAPCVVLSAIALERLADGLRFVDDELVGWSNDRLPVVIALLVATTVLSLISSIAATRLMIDTIDEVPAGTHLGPEAAAAVGAIGSAVRVIPRFVGWMLAAGAVVLLSLAVTGGLMAVALPIGIIVLIGLFPLAFWIAIKLAFVPIAIVDRRGNPFRRSWEVSRQRFWATCGRLILVSGVVYAASSAANMPLSLVNSARFDTFSSEPEWITTDEAGNVESIDFGPLFDVTWWSLATVVVVSVVISVVVSGVIYSALATMYRTRNSVQR